MVYAGYSLLTAMHLAQAARAANDNNNRTQHPEVVDDALARGTYKVIQATGRLIERTLVRNMS